MPERLYHSGIDYQTASDLVESGSLTVGVYGLGKMGLPVAAVYADTVGTVVGADVDPDIVQMVNRGESPVENEPGLPELVADQVDAGQLSATTNPAEVAEQATIHVVIVPTLLNENDNPDLSIVQSVVSNISSGLDEGDFVVIESTVPPGSTGEKIKPRILEHSDCSEGEFGLAFCPERTASGSALTDIRESYPKVVGGVDEESTRVAKAIYDSINTQGAIPVSDAKTAESAKIFEGVFRDVNIALANEVAKLSDEIGVDANEAIEVANTVSFIDIHNPGPGVGGHCIPYYPHFVMSRASVDTPLLRTSRDINDDMPRYTVEKLEQQLSAVGKDISGTTVLILGLTYRPGVVETRASPAIGVSHILSGRGATTRLVDPLVEDVSEFAGERVPLEMVTNENAGAAVVVTPHQQFSEIDWQKFDPMVIVDGRDSLQVDSSKHRVFAIGGGLRQYGTVRETDE